MTFPTPRRRQCIQKLVLTVSDIYICRNWKNFNVRLKSKIIVRNITHLSPSLCMCMQKILYALYVSLSLKKVQVTIATNFHSLGLCMNVSSVLRHEREQSFISAHRAYFSVSYKRNDLR